MEQQLYRVKVRRIRRQVAEAYTDSLDRLFHTSDLVERDVVDHHNVSALERWDQTLLDVSTSPFMAPLISIGATTPVCRSPAINVTVSQCPIGASLTKRSPRGFQPLSRSMLVVTAVSSINTRWAGSRKPCSQIQRRRARATSARFRSAVRRLFFNGDPMAGKNRESALRLPGFAACEAPKRSHSA